MGWSYGVMWTRTKFPDMRMDEAARLADAINVPRGKFLAMLADYVAGPAPKLPPKDKGLSRVIPLSHAKGELLANRGPGRPRHEDRL